MLVEAVEIIGIGVLQITVGQCRQCFLSLLNHVAPTFMELNHPEATAQALSILRNAHTFHWQIITLLMVVLYIYGNEIQKRNHRGVAAGLALYMVHWWVEIINALIQYFFGHALWTVPTGTSFLLLVGVGAEINLMFAIAALAMSKFLPDDPHARILGFNNRWVWIISNAAFCAVFEILLVQTPGFVWVYPWWGAFPVFLTVYLPFWAAAAYAYDASPSLQMKLIGGLFIINVSMLGLFAGVLEWI